MANQHERHQMANQHAINTRDTIRGPNRRVAIHYAALQGRGCGAPTSAVHADAPAGCCFLRKDEDGALMASPATCRRNSEKGPCLVMPSDGITRVKIENIKNKVPA